MTDHQYDLIVVGAGPGGYVAAVRAAQLGWKVACVEKERELGGTCLRVGCIPSKILLESSELFWEAGHGFANHGIRFDKLDFDLEAMMARKRRVVQSLTKGVEYLFKKQGVTHYRGQGRLAARDQVVVSSADREVSLTAANILLATGSKAACPPQIPLEGDRIATSTEALSYGEVPKNLVVIGAGAIGLELGSVWRRLGARVTVVELLDRILPEMDRETAAEALKILKKQGIDFHLGRKVAKAWVEGSDCVVECDGMEPIRCDRVLVAVGRVPNTSGVGLESLEVETDAKGRISVDDHFRTSVPGIYAIGDVIPGPMLAHKAEEEGLACVERLITGYGHVDYDTIPNVVYTHPEIASVGKSEEELKTREIDYRTGLFSFKANGRAQTLGHPEGRVKVLADAQSDRILGVHILGPRAGDLIAEAATAMAFGASSEDVARTCHAHPTLPEAFREAALAVSGRAIHS